MNYKHCCVVNASGFYVEFVLVVDGEIQYYELQPDETLVEANAPGGFIRPKWDGEKWCEGASPDELPPPPSLGEVKAAKREELRHYRDAIIDQGFGYAGYVFPLTQDVQISLMQQFLGSQAMPAPSYSWKDMDGIYREIGNAATFQVFCTRAMMYGKSLYDREEMLQTLVNAAESIEDVAAITWDTVPEEVV